MRDRAMPKRSKLRISKRAVEALPVGDRDVAFWDHELPGFGVRVYASGRMIYVVQCRGPAGIKRVSLGEHGDLTADQARRRARAAIGRIKRGEEPIPGREQEAAPTVADLAQRYMEAHAAVNCNAHTRKTYRSALDNHILPALGSKPVTEVRRADAEALHYALRDTPRQANRVLMVLSKMFSLAEDWGFASLGSNPCRFVVRYREGMRKRFLTEDEYRRVGRALRELETESPMRARAAAALRLLMLTGCRLTEILTLRWDDIDHKTGEIRLRDAKTGARMVVLTPAALRVLTETRRVLRSPWVFTGSARDTHLASLSKPWLRVRARAGIEDVRIHDLRHSYASRALALGEGLTMIGRLLGHTDVGSTARYAHLERDAEKVAVDRVGDSIAADILRTEGDAAPNVDHAAGTGIRDASPPSPPAA